LLSQVLDALKIEIPQLITHIIGFLIALWILKRYAWKPLLALLDERRERIKNGFAEIETKQKQADALNAEYQSRLKDIDTEARRRLTEAMAEGEKIAAKIKENARNEAKDMFSRSKAEIEQDMAKARVELKNDVVAMTITAAERIIHERLDTPKQRELIGRFIDDIEKVK
jgi:F-type H+-transporting ATPase subunit b